MSIRCTKWLRLQRTASLIEYEFIQIDVSDMDLPLIVIIHTVHVKTCVCIVTDDRIYVIVDLNL